MNRGITIIGENYVQEAEKKKPLITKAVEWHLIGPLQKNKIARALRIFDVIETIDSLSLASAVNGRAQKKIDILIQVNATGEKTKHGMKPEDVALSVPKILRLPNIRLRGIMTMGPTKQDPKQTHAAFALTKSLFDKCRQICGNTWNILSMGMSDDYEMAIKCGATQVRLGRLLFADR